MHLVAERLELALELREIQCPEDEERGIVRNVVLDAQPGREPAAMPAQPLNVSLGKGVVEPATHRDIRAGGRQPGERPASIPHADPGAADLRKYRGYARLPARHEQPFEPLAIGRARDIRHSAASRASPSPPASP